jgi:citrate/tricarballylate utilization protein
MWGFILCFGATSVAAVYEYGLDWIAPYSFFSMPVLLGTFGGIGLLIGPAGLIWIKLQSDPRPMFVQQFGMDYAFLALLFFISLTGFLLLGLRATSAMGVLLALHLGFVLALFLMLPYSKFVHAVYRFAALMRFALEQRREQVKATLI